MGTLKRVVLFKNGYGLFVRQFTVTGDQTIHFPILTSNMDEVVSSLTTLDLGGGRIQSISYENHDVLQGPLRNLIIPLASKEKGDFLNSILQGCKVEVKIGEEILIGCLFPLSQKQNLPPEETIVSLHLDSGAIRIFNLSEISEIKPLESGISQKIQAFLDINRCMADNDYSVLSVKTSGEGTRTVQMSYVMSVPSWDITYRLLLPKEPGKCKAVLQSLALLTNPGTDPWENIDLTLKSSFFICPSALDRKEEKRRESYEYHISHPISIPPFGSVMIPLSDDVLDCENVLVYNPLDEDIYPYCGAVIRNMTRNILGEGSLMVFQKETFCGRTKMPSLHPGEMHLVRFAENNECKAKSSCRISEEKVTGVSIRAGDLILRWESLVQDDYEVQNTTTQKKEMIIEHPHLPDQRLMRPRNPYHSTPNAWGFKITVPPDIAIEFQIESVRQNQIIHPLTDLTGEEIEDFISKQILDQEIGQTLLVLIQSRKEIKTKDASPGEREEELKKIDQSLRDIVYEKNISLRKEGE